MKIGEVYINSKTEATLILEIVGVLEYSYQAYVLVLIGDNGEEGKVITIATRSGSLHYNWIKLEGIDKIENMKVGDFYKNKEMNDVIMVEEILHTKLLVKMKFVMTTQEKHQIGDEVWFDTRVMESRYEKL